MNEFNTAAQVALAAPTAMEAGWYPQSEGGERYWDGTAWTEHVVAAAACDDMRSVASSGQGPLVAGLVPIAFLSLVTLLVFVLYLR